MSNDYGIVSDSMKSRLYVEQVRDRLPCVITVCNGFETR